MLAIRLSRTGKIHAPHYRIVVQEKRSKLNGKTVDVIGHYHPAQAGKALVIDKEKAEAWIKKGAQASDTVTNLLVKEGVLDKSHKVHNFFTPTKKEEKAPEAEVKEETPAEEVPAEAPAAEVMPEVAAEETTEVAPATEEAAAAPTEEPAKEGEEAAA